MDGVRCKDKTATPAAPGTARRCYFTYFGLTALNPWPALYFVALMLGTSQNAMGRLETAAYITAVIVASGSWQLLLAGVGASLGRAVTSGKGRTATAMVSSALITLLALSLLASS